VQHEFIFYKYGDKNPANSGSIAIDPLFRNARHGRGKLVIDGFYCDGDNAHHDRHIDLIHT